MPNRVADAWRKRTRRCHPQYGSMASSCTADSVQTYHHVSHVSSRQENSMRVENPIALGQCTSKIWPHPSKLIVDVPRRGNLAFSSIAGFFESVQTKDAASICVEWLNKQPDKLIRFGLQKSTGAQFSPEPPKNKAPDARYQARPLIPNRSDALSGVRQKHVASRGTVEAAEQTDIAYSHIRLADHTYSQHTRRSPHT